MAAAQGLYAENLSAVSANLTYTDVVSISAASFTAGKKYLILATAFLDHASATADGKVRLVHGTTPTVFTDAEAIIGVQGGGSGWVFQWLTVWDQPGTTELIKLQVASSSSTSACTVQMGQIFALKLSDDFTENTDWFYNEVTADYTTTTTATAQASITIPDAAINGTDDWMVIGHRAVRTPDATTQSVRSQLHESVGGTTLPASRFIGENTSTEVDNSILARVYTLSDGAAHTLSTRFYHDASISAAGTVFSSRIFALNLNKFSQHFGEYTEASATLSASPTWDTEATESITPSVTGDWFYLGIFTVDPSVTTESLAVRLRHDNSGADASDPAYGDDEPGVFARDTSDEPTVSLFKMRSLTSGASRTVKYEATALAGASLAVKHRGLVGFSLELASGGTDIVKDITAALTTDAAQALGFTLGPAISKSLTNAATTDVAQALSFTQAAISKSLTPSTTTDVAQVLGFTNAAISKTLTPAVTTDAAQPLSFSQAAIQAVITAALELDTAVPLTFFIDNDDIQIVITPATTSDTAQALGFTLGPAISKTLTPAVTLDVAVPLIYSVEAAAAIVRAAKLMFGRRGYY